MPKPRNPPGTTRRSHAFGGCGTCRKRHVKCDQVRPSCLTCQAVGVVCTGYHAELRWMATPKTLTGQESDQDGDKATAQFPRRHLYSEDSRASMSTALVSNLSTKSVDASLLELDTLYRDTSITSSQSIAVGPFGVFSLTALDCVVDDSPDSVHHQDYDVQDQEHHLQQFSSQLSPRTAESAESLPSLQDWLDWPDLFELDFNFPELIVPAVMASCNDTAPSAQCVSLVQSETNSLMTNCERIESTAQSEPFSVETFSLTKDSEQAGQLGLMDRTDSEKLLGHFQLHVIPAMAPLLLRSKSAWEVTHVSSAILSLARKTYMPSQHISHAALANLRAICAIAASHLAYQESKNNKRESGRWQEVADRMIKEAKKNLQISLQNETQGPQAAKYKDQLMAISSVMTFAILYGPQKDARACMVDAERLLRLRGLAKPTVSRKSRLLHHCYTWTRILGESTNVLRTFQGADLNAATQISSHSRKRRRVTGCNDSVRGVGSLVYHDDHNPRLDDFLRLEPNVQRTGRRRMDRKDRKTGLRDIHLEDSREWSEGLYIQLYGISETWVSLLSQTTRLANVLDCMASSKDRNTDFMESLDRRKSRLENMICSLISNHEAVEEADTQESHQQPDEEHQEMAPTCTSTSAQACMVRALNSALVIYFYRRIRNVNPWILQEHVNHVIKALKDNDIARDQYGVSGPGSPWPCFMAGCEAMTETQRGYFTRWLDQAIETTGFTRFDDVKLVMVEVWKQRDLMGGRRANKMHSETMPSWIDVLRNQQMTLSLS